MRNVAIATVAAAALSACSVGHAREPGPHAERNYSVGGFDKIEVAGPYRVAVATGPAPSVHASGGRNDLEDMVVEVAGGTLKIHPRSHHGISFGWNHRSGDIRVAVTVPSLRAAAIAGSGGIDVDQVRVPDFHGEVAGSGGLTLKQMQVQTARFEIAGSGDVRAAGQAQAVHVEIAGSGGVEAAALNAQDAKVEIMGSGSVNAHATRTANIEIMGSGDVNLSGGAQCHVEKHGSGDVRCS